MEEKEKKPDQERMDRVGEKKDSEISTRTISPWGRLCMIEIVTRKVVG